MGQAMVHGTPLTVNKVGLKVFWLEISSTPKLAALPPLGCRPCQLPPFTLPVTTPRAPSVAAQFQYCKHGQPRVISRDPPVC